MQTRKKKILLVDDSRTSLFMERMILQGPYELVIANDGAEGVEQARAESPDLILMDVVMPRMTGFEALRVLRSEEATRHIPVIMVTTRGESDNVEEGWEAGCSDYVNKPINPEELLAKVRSCLAS